MGLAENAAALKKEIEATIAGIRMGQKPAELYEPIDYIMGLGGKRLRPMLVLLAYRLFKDDYQAILPAACTVEFFHNFTLMHDDIMDEAPLRRGKPTVHKVWDENVAILSGDVMLVGVYQQVVAHVPPALLPAVLEKFSAMAAEVCEGQQYDVNFEAMPEVSVAQYIDMIRQKTAVLLGYSLWLGAVLAGQDKAVCQQLYALGVNAGIGFQLQDDWLDVFGEQAKVGKQVGGDIISNKKTFLLIRALELAQGPDKVALLEWLGKAHFDPAEKVQAVTALYNKLEVGAMAHQQMEDYLQKAYNGLADLPVAQEEGRTVLKAFIDTLIRRDQ